MHPLKPLQPILTTDLFLPLQKELIRLLRGLKEEDWQRPTACPAWAVQDIAAHLLDGDLRRLSFGRDGHSGPPPAKPITSYGDLVSYLNQLNAEWTAALNRVSPGLLIELLEFTGPKVAQFFSSLDPQAPAIFPVSWAGDEVSPNWFDLAREYTEKWLHQQQIRDATDSPPLTTRAWLFPVLDTFMRGLPHAYRDLEAPKTTEVAIRITGEAGDLWTLRHTTNAWTLLRGETPHSTSQITLDQDTAWRLFSKGITPSDARALVQVDGQAHMSEPLFRFLAIMA